MRRPPAARVGFIGLGMMARGHLREVLDRPGSRVIAVCEPSDAAYAAAVLLFRERGLKPPPNEPDPRRWLAVRPSARRRRDRPAPCAPLRPGDRVSRSRSGRDPREADDDDRARGGGADRDPRSDRPIADGRVPGHAVAAQRRGETAAPVRRAGPILNINAVVWQDWATNTAGSWRQQPEASGGGFLFDTGAHMLNTVTDLPARTSPRSPPGRRTTATRSTSAPW